MNTSSNHSSRVASASLLLASVVLMSACQTNPLAPAPAPAPVAQAPRTGPGGCIYPQKTTTVMEPRGDRTKSMTIGALVGALGGAAVGSQTSDKSSVGARNGALLGGLVGALAGSAYANQMKAVERPDGTVQLEVPGSVMFAVDSADLSPQFQSTLDAVGKTIATYCGVDAEIIGHTDSSGDDAYNLALSQRRAASAQTYLQSYLSRTGITDRTLATSGMGEAQPIADNTTEAGKAQNRRVEILLKPRATS